MAGEDASRSTEVRRVVLAFALAPMLPAFYATIFFAQPWAFPIGLLLAYPTALLLGLPLFLLMRAHCRLRWWQCGLAGVGCALPALGLYWHLGTPPHLDSFSPLNAFYLLVWGGFTGLCFWLLAVAGKSPLSLRSMFGLGPPV